MKKKLGTSKIRFFTLFSMMLIVASCGNLGPVEPNQGGGIAPVSHNSNSSTGTQNCTVDAVRYPTTLEDFQKLLYGNRGFLTEYNGSKHLGHDIIYAEGIAIHPIACGKIVYYGPANGYGTLVIVIEHKLAVPLTVINGDGTTTTITAFLTIYGHQRKTQQMNGGNALTWQVGDYVGQNDIISYVQGDAANGDGPEHLHLGIRLQSMTEAKAVDPSAWFRGNDSADGKYKKYYTDPAIFIPKVQAALEGTSSNDDPEQAATALHYPIGTLLQEFGTGYWLVVGENSILNATGYDHLPKGCAINMPLQALNCYTQVQFDPFSLYLDAKIIKFDGEPQVYQLFPGNGFAPTSYRTFLSYDSFLSWGNHDSDIVSYPLAQKSSVLGVLQDKGMVGFMPGALVKGKGQSEVAVADQNGQRRPIFNWDVFTALGYQQQCIYEIEPTTLDVVAGSRSDQVITLSDTEQCGAKGQGGSAGAGGSGGQGGSTGTGGSTGNGGSSGSTGQGGSQSNVDAGAGGSGGQGNLCVPGSTISCACGGGVTGNQTCRSDGQAYDACICPDAGSGGFGGSQGQGGSTSTGGSINVGGSSGAGGSTSTGGSSSTGGSGGTMNIGGSSGSGGTFNNSSLCQAKGVAGKVTFLANAPVGQSNNMSFCGWIDYPGWSGVPDVSWNCWAWGATGVNEFVFQKGDAYQGAKYIFAPGVSSGYGQPQDAWYCEKSGCPIGTFVVCNGQQEACRVQNGVLSGGASYNANQAGWQNIQCVLP